MNTAQFTQHVNRLFTKHKNQLDRQLHASIGLASEGGELLDAVNKTWTYGKPMDMENVLEECGDAMFYVTAMLISSGFTLEQAMDHNYNKLKSRYPDGYTDAAAIARADKN